MIVSKVAPILCCLFGAVAYRFVTSMAWTVQAKDDEVMTRLQHRSLGLQFVGDHPCVNLFGEEPSDDSWAGNQAIDDPSVINWYTT